MIIRHKNGEATNFHGEATNFRGEATNFRGEATNFRGEASGNPIPDTRRGYLQQAPPSIIKDSA